MSVHNYTASIDGGEGGTREILAGGWKEAWDEALDWAYAGDWEWGIGPHEDGDGVRYCSVRCALSLRDGDGNEVYAEHVTVWDADTESEARLPKRLRCPHEGEHDWGDGGDEWGGNRSHGGMAMSHTSVCARCGVRRSYYHDHQHEHSWRDHVTYHPAEPGWEPAGWEHTHTIHHDGYRSEQVCLTDGAAYTRLEWQADAPADYELVDGEWLFQGAPFPGRVERAS